jgi:hypothetical protein
MADPDRTYRQATTHVTIGRVAKCQNCGKHESVPLTEYSPNGWYCSDCDPFIPDLWALIKRKQREEERLSWQAVR